MNKGTYTRNIEQDEKNIAFARIATYGGGLLPVLEAAGGDAKMMVTSASVSDQLPSLDDYFEMLDWLHAERDKLMEYVDMDEVDRGGNASTHKYDDHLVASTLTLLLESAWLLHFMPAIRNYHIHMVAEAGCLEAIANWKFENPEVEALRDVALDKYHEVAEGIGYNMELVEQAKGSDPDLEKMLKVLDHRIQQAGGLGALFGDIMPKGGDPFGDGQNPFGFDFPL